MAEKPSLHNSMSMNAQLRALTSIMLDQEGGRLRNEARFITSSMKRPSFLVFGLTPYRNTNTMQHDQPINANGMQTQCNACKHNVMQHDQPINANGMQTQCNACKHNAMQQACKHNANNNIQTTCSMDLNRIWTDLNHAQNSGQNTPK